MISPKTQIQNMVCATAQALWGKETVLEKFEVETKDNASFGDYSVNLPFLLAPQLGKSPKEIAHALAQKIKDESFVEDAQVAGGGFVNIFLKKDYWGQTLTNLQDISFDALKGPTPKKVIVEFSSPNVARPMHMGHIRNTILGDFLARLYTLLGHHVIRWNHLGDWGTQFGKLIVAYKEGWTDKDAVEKNPIEELVNIYVRFHDEVKTNPDLEKRAQEEFKKLEDGDLENTKLLDWFRTESLKEFKKTYDALGISFDVERGESAYLEDMPRIIKQLKKEGLAQESEGALIVPLEDEGLPPAMIEKSDGATLYMTRDLASLDYRLNEYHPDEILYVVGNEQSLHFRQFFAIAKKLGHTTVHLEHVPYGIVLSAQTKKKLSTRGGVVITGTHMLSSVTQKALEIVREKQPDISDQEADRIARQVAVSALRYSLLRDQRASDIVFDPEASLALHGNSAPYLQYAHTRLSKILERVEIKEPPTTPRVVEDSFIPLIKHLSDFEHALIRCEQDHSSHHLAQYLFELASLSNALYEQHSILHEEDPEKKASLLTLVTATKRVFEIGFELFGITTLQTM